MSISGDGTTGGAPGLSPRERGPYPLHGRSAARQGRPVEAVADGVERAGDDIGYRGPTACAAAGITYRQLDYWARTGLVEPSVRPPHGGGAQRLYGFCDVVVLKIVKRLLDTGVSLQNIRTTVQHLRDGGFRDLERMTLMSDGATVYECTSPDEVVGLLQGGQGVFGIAVGVVCQDVESALAQLHGERVETGETVIRHHPADELARRRNRAV
ncbi:MULTISPECIES: MerR family transcriptional regulator [Streptomyces]|uniref:MerR family transcriptional regulator n=4 Tax=Streptomyces TaxID=1883 RepID=A0A8H9HUY4_9ACTN|nr:MULTISPECIES: MerR family transcriptional regulator [Streptomyces]NEC12190.1 MerR family transcriptional regulator [Streptomyces sp. SID8014]NEE57164.1 MerR family transcriptional regulator [Streptomyces sp. SID8455]MBL3807809.1 MerR family transcriptional regulator [Streptomyces sp. BRB081]PJM82603.1 MerR family transcriptional regulator [Streptomyces sp. TSRI0384-2]QNE80196.1 MerR family transcriptional regulator [Streptomyces rutgersensis]